MVEKVIKTSEIRKDKNNSRSYHNNEREQEVANSDSEIDTDSSSDESGDDVVITDTLISNEHSDSESTDSYDMDVDNDINKCWRYFHYNKKWTNHYELESFKFLVK